ncbi:MAG: hypothetical protein ACP5QT_02860 [Brevinematia bacterium]
MHHLYILILFILLAGCGSLKENILLTIDGETEEFSTSDFTNAVSKALREKYHKTPRIFVIKEENVYEKVFSSPSSFLKDFNKASETKYFYVISIRPIENQLKNRLEYEMLFASVESEAENIVYSRKPVISPYKVIQWLESFDEKDPSNIRKIFVFGKKSDKLLVLINTNRQWKSIDIKNISNGVNQIFNKISASNIICEMRGSSFELTKLLKTNNLFEDEFFDDAGKAFIFAISPTSKTTNERNFFEALFFSARSSFKNIFQIDAPAKSGEFFIDLSIIFSNYSQFDSDTVIYWKVNPDALEKKFIEFKKYGEFIDLEDNYVLVSSIDKIMPKGYLEVDEFLENKESTGENRIIKTLQENILEKRLFHLFYNPEKKTLRKLIFFEYVTTGKVTIKLAFGPIEPDKTEFYATELKKLGIKIETKPFSPKNFR